MPSAGNLVVLDVISDGGDQASLGSVTNISNIAGTTSSMTLPTSFAVGGASEASRRIWYGRVTSNGDVSVVINAFSSGAIDAYARMYEFDQTPAGTAITDVLDGVATDNNAATSTTVLAIGRTVSGTNRLAVNLVALANATSIDAFTGASGGTWVEPVPEFQGLSGSAATLAIFTAAIDTGTIGGGSTSIVSSPWSSVGITLEPSGSNRPALVNYSAGVSITGASGTVSISTGTPGASRGSLTLLGVG